MHADLCPLACAHELVKSPTVQHHNPGLLISIDPKHVAEMEGHQAKLEDAYRAKSSISVLRPCINKACLNKATGRAAALHSHRAGSTMLRLRAQYLPNQLPSSRASFHAVTCTEPRPGFSLTGPA